MGFSLSHSDSEFLTLEGNFTCHLAGCFMFSSLTDCRTTFFKHSVVHWFQTNDSRKRSQTLHHGDKENLFDVTRLFFKNNMGTNALAYQHNHTGRLILKQRHSECTSMFVKTLI